MKKINDITWSDPYYFVKDFLPFKRGSRDFVNGIKKNPYKNSSLEYDLWREGYESAKIGSSKNKNF